MKISVYELLGMVKDGKAPKKIRIISASGVYDKEFYFDGDIYMYKDEYEEYAMTDDISIEMALNDEVEILEEEKKIPEKLSYFDLTKDKNEKDENGNNLKLHYTGVADTFDDVYEKINNIIDYLDYLKSKGE